VSRESFVNGGLIRISRNVTDGGMQHEYVEILPQSVTLSAKYAFHEFVPRFTLMLALRSLSKAFGGVQEIACQASPHHAQFQPIRVELRLHPRRSFQSRHPAGLDLEISAFQPQNANSRNIKKRVDAALTRGRD
jgi:hypothetical protein